MCARVLATLLIAAACLTAAACEKSVTGRPGLWLSGRELRAKFTISGGVLSADLRNDTASAVNIEPVTVTVWYRGEGKRELSFTSFPPRLSSGQTFSTGRLFDDDPRTARDVILKAQVVAGQGRGREIFVVTP